MRPPSSCMDLITGVKKGSRITIAAHIQVAASCTNTETALGAWGLRARPCLRLPTVRGESRARVCAPARHSLTRPRPPAARRAA
jgi:hypothetical protein